MPTAPWAAAVACLLAAGLVPAGAVLSQVGASRLAEARRSAPGLYTIPLHQERAPIKRAGKVVSHKTTYSGTIHVGSPVPQEFSVVFDTGSAHLIFPAAECRTEACLRRRRYNMTASSTGKAVKLSGQPVRAGELTDQVSIGFGTGKVVGETVREEVCLGPAAEPGPCVRASAVVATSMSGSSFDELNFDGIFGLGLSSLALSKAFSIFDVLVASGQLAHPYFSVFLARDATGRSSEIAIGGHSERHRLTPFSWVPTVKPELGYWQVAIASIRVNGEELDVCQDGTCSGILDSGSSHLGLPSSHFAALDGLLARPAWSASEDCRDADSPTLELELSGVNLTLYPRDYMRPLPLSTSVMKRSAGTMPNAEQYCRAKLMPMNWPPPIGPKAFILGEVVLQRYYTAYDWSGPRAGFALADQDGVAPRVPVAAAAEPPRWPHPSDEIMLVQVTVSIGRGGGTRWLSGAPGR